MIDTAKNMLSVAYIFKYHKLIIKYGLQDKEQVLLLDQRRMEEQLAPQELQCT
jgi:hypothetical protein